MILHVVAMTMHSQKIQWAQSDMVIGQTKLDMLCMESIRKAMAKIIGSPEESTIIVNVFRLDDSPTKITRRELDSDERHGPPADQFG